MHTNSVELKEQLELLREIANKGFIPESDLLKKGNKELIKKLEYLDFIAYGVNAKGENTIILTKKGKEFLKIEEKLQKGGTFIEKIVNLLLFNKILRNILGDPI